MEVGVEAVVAATAICVAMAVAAIQVVVVVSVIKPTTVESGITTVKLLMHLSVTLAALENIRASGV